MYSGIIKSQNRHQERTAPLADSLRELQELGCPVDISVGREEFRLSKLEIQQSGGAHDSNVFELEDGRFAFMLDLELYNHASEIDTYCRYRNAMALEEQGSAA